MATQSPNPTAHYSEANQPCRTPRNAAASQQARTVFSAALNAGGTQSSAGNYDRRQSSSTRNPCARPLSGPFRACVAGSVRSLDASALPRHSTILGMQAMRKIDLNLL